MRRFLGIPGLKKDKFHLHEWELGITKFRAVHSSTSQQLLKQYKNFKKNYVWLVSMPHPMFDVCLTKNN